MLEKQYFGVVCINGEMSYTPLYDTKDEAQLELRCLEKRLSFETIKTVEEEGVYPERAALMEKKYQESGRTNGLYTGLSTVSDS